MNISRKQFVKLLTGGLAAIGIGGKVVAEKFKPTDLATSNFDVKFTGQVATKSYKDAQRVINQQLSNLVAYGTTHPEAFPIEGRAYDREFAKIEESLWDTETTSKRSERPRININPLTRRSLDDRR